MENGPDGITAPVFDLKQQFRDSHPWSNITNGGAIYAGTHGRGIFVNGIADVDEEEIEIAQASWNVFPNPVTGGELSLPTMGWQGQARIEIFDLTGRRWVNDVTTLGGLSGCAQMWLNCHLDTTWCACRKETKPRQPNLW